MEDCKIIELYFQRSENAIFETDLKYGKYCKRVAFNILNNREDTAECVSDAYLKAWDSIPPKSPKNLGGWICKVTRNLAINRLSFLNAEKRGGDQVVSALQELEQCVSGDDEASAEDGEITREINSFLKGLNKRERCIFVRRYWYLQSAAEIAKAYGLKENNVNVILFRTRKKLKNHLEKRGITI